MMRFAGRGAALSTLLILALLLAGGCSATGKAPAPAAPAAEPAAARIQITTLDDLPAHSYPLAGTVTELLQDPAALAALRAAYRADLESDLATYEITDAATLQGMYGRLASLDMLDGDTDAALERLDQVGELEDKEAARLMNGLVMRSLVAAGWRPGVDAADPAYRAALKAELERRVAALPWDVVQDQLKAGKGRAEMFSENMLLGLIQAQIEPAAAAMGGLSADLAGAVIGMRYALDNVLPVNPLVAEVYGAAIERNAVEKRDIWPARELVLAADRGLDPVVIGIWDSGVDAAVFGDRMFVNPEEKFNGNDCDSNGWVDDVHGIAFDLDGVANSHMLHPLGDQEGKLDQVYEYMQGFVDLTSAIDSPQASSVRATMGAMAPEEVGDFLTSLSFGGLYMHGTHVAGIAAAGNPFARLLVARITFDYHTTPQAMTLETARRLAEDYVRTTAYFSQNGVRVVNMSWGWTFKEIEGGLEANGVGADAAERARLAREMIDILSDGLRRSMELAPEILFVTAAGNDDNDVEFDVVIPSSFDLPNLMVIGAVDQAGDPTGFTSGGRNVRVYANGFQVESSVPGGGTMKMSGTSMASPNVCNLAAKLIALDPVLTPAEVVQLIEQGADPNPEHPEILLINPKRSAELLAG